MNSTHRRISTGTIRRGANFLTWGQHDALDPNSEVDNPTVSAEYIIDRGFVWPVDPRDDRDRAIDEAFGQYARCLHAGVHLIATRHRRQDCPTTMRDPQACA